MTSLRAWAHTHAGPVRRSNQDAFLVAPDLGLFALADGMGGLHHGEVASALACSVVRSELAWARLPDDTGPDRLAAALHAAVEAACAQVHQWSAGRTRIGTTLEVILCRGGYVACAHVGDSRTYLRRGGRFVAITEDHSLAEEVRRAGLITAEEAAHDRSRHVVTRAVGLAAQVQVDMLTFALEPDDRLLLCSDGLHELVHAEDLERVVASVRGGTAVEVLVELALRRGARDNVTALLLEPEGPSPEASSPWLAELRRVPLFVHGPDRVLLRLAQACRQRDVPAGAALFHEGSAAEELLVLLRGRVAVTRAGVHLQDRHPPEALGAVGLLDGAPRSATATALDDCRVLALPRARLVQLVQEDPAFGVGVLWKLGHRVARDLRTARDRIAGDPPPDDRRPVALDASGDEPD